MQLRAEIDEQDLAGTLSNPIMCREAQNLPYLQAVIKEALRLHPATGLPLGRAVPEGGAEIAGHYFPEKVSSVLFEVILGTNLKEMILRISQSLV
jgi:cytochrome P450